MGASLRRKTWPLVIKLSLETVRRSPCLPPINRKLPSREGCSALVSTEPAKGEVSNPARRQDSSIGKPDPTYNGVTQVKMIVAELGCQGLFSCVFSLGLMRFKDEIMEKIRNHHASKDIGRMLNSKSNPRYRKIFSFNVTRPEDYLQFRALNLNKLRAVSRLRVASKDVMKIYLKDAIMTIKSSEGSQPILIASKDCHVLFSSGLPHFFDKAPQIPRGVNSCLKVPRGGIRRTVDR
ncbi:unnamed protein product [Nezara viridula]|uniref:Uncharacterized protein n=1 Tax=Nezara viridula TaxID=85310 RepID=A0A9P0E6T2_NEZVI|nr:unnamed protein product [Nezara viridula]